MTILTTSSVGPQGRPQGESATEGLRQARARRVARALATHPILPLPREVPLDDEPMHRLLADLAGADKSQHAHILREVSEERGVSVGELARRAQFMLACLLLPASGTFYEILDVTPDASAREIRKHWAAAIHRYHPDRFGGRNPWLDAQARRLIEAYETLRDPERRRRYDAEFGRTPRPEALGERRGAARGRRLSVGRCLPWTAMIVLIGITFLGLATAAALRLTPAPLLPAPLPPAPKLLEKWLGPPAGQSLDTPASRRPVAADKSPGEGDAAP